MSPTRPPNDLRRPRGVARRSALALLVAASIGLGGGLRAASRLRGADFQARRPPAEAREHAEKLGAETCALVVPASETQVAGKAVRVPTTASSTGAGSAASHSAR